MKNDFTNIRVISDTTTFYPLDQDGDESQQRNDNMTLRTTLIYLNNQLNEDFRFFCAGDLYIVLQQWREMLFFIQTNEFTSAEIMRMQLQTVREILIFLFGTKFESVMRRNISLAKRQVFAGYIDKYLEWSMNDYLPLINSIRFDDDPYQISELFKQSVSSIYPNYDINLLTALLFNNGNLISIYFPSNDIRIEPETIVLLQLFIKVEYGNFENSNLENPFDTNFIKSDNNDSIKHKNAFLRIERTPIGCTLSSSRSKENSSLVLLIVSQNLKMDEQMKKNIIDFMGGISNFFSSMNLMNHITYPIKIEDGLIHFVVLNRTKGDIFEIPYNISINLLSNYKKNLSNEEILNLLKKLNKKMSSYAMTALIDGFTTMIWGELEFQFSYEMRFEDENGNLIKPTNVFSPPPFDDDNGINYSLISNSLFPSSKSIITIYEILTIFIGKIQTKIVMKTNEEIFQEFKKKKNLI